MATSYTIYIRDLTSGGGGGSSHTKAKTPSEKATSKTSAERFMAKYKSLENKIHKIGSFASEASLMKLGWVGVALIAIKKTHDFALKVADKVVPLVSSNTGNRDVAMNYENYKSSVNNVFHPISFAINQVQVESSLYLDNITKHENQVLTGNSIVNSFEAKV